MLGLDIPYHSVFINGLHHEPIIHINRPTSTSGMTRSALCTLNIMHFGLSEWHTWFSQFDLANVCNSPRSLRTQRSGEEADSPWCPVCVHPSLQMEVRHYLRGFVWWSTNNLGLSWWHLDGCWSHGCSSRGCLARQVNWPKIVIKIISQPCTDFFA